jgi:sialidase-1
MVLMATALAAAHLATAVAPPAAPPLDECGPDIWTNSTSCPSVTASVDVFSARLAAPRPYTYRIPALIWAGNRTPDLLAFIEARNHAVSDHGDVGIALRRSTDRGVTFGSFESVRREMNHTIGNAAPIYNPATGEVVLLFSRDNKEVWVMTSLDDRGKSWSTARNISAATMPFSKDWEWVATGPSGGIRIETGPRAGRLVQCCDHMECSVRGGCKDVSVPEPWNYTHKGSHVIYSDDHGRTWRLGGIVGNGGKVNGGECAVAMLPQPPSSGHNETMVMAIERDMGSQYVGQDRAFALSSDFGETFHGTTYKNTGVSTSDCEASLIRAAAGLFLTHVQPGRAHLTLSVSTDGLHWRNLTDLTGSYAAAGYSSLLVLNDSHLLCLWERGSTISMMHIQLHSSATNGAGTVMLPTKSDDADDVPRARQYVPRYMTVYDFDLDPQHGTQNITNLVSHHDLQTLDNASASHPGLKGMWMFLGGTSANHSGHYSGGECVPNVSQVFGEPYCAGPTGLAPFWQTGVQWVVTQVVSRKHIAGLWLGDEPELQGVSYVSATIVSSHIAVYIVVVVVGVYDADYNVFISTAGSLSACRMICARSAWPSRPH